MAFSLTPGQGFDGVLNYTTATKVTTTTTTKVTTKVKTTMTATMATEPDNSPCQITKANCALCLQEIVMLPSLKITKLPFK